jgi:hypothetical protein
MGNCLAKGCNNESEIAGLCRYHSSIHHRLASRARLAMRAAVLDYAQRHGMEDKPYAQQYEAYLQSNKGTQS